MEFFTIREMCCSSSFPALVEYPRQGDPVYSNLTRLIDEVLDPVRRQLGRGIVVLSGYRSPKLNAAVGGSKTSAHLQGLAADLWAKGNNMDIVRALIYSGVAFDQCIIEYPKTNSGLIVGARWIHIGIKPDKTAYRGQYLIWDGTYYKRITRQAALKLC